MNQAKLVAKLLKTDKQPVPELQYNGYEASREYVEKQYDVIRQQIQSADNKNLDIPQLIAQLYIAHLDMNKYLFVDEQEQQEYLTGNIQNLYDAIRERFEFEWLFHARAIYHWLKENGINRADVIPLWGIESDKPFYDILLQEMLRWADNNINNTQSEKVSGPLT